MYAIFDTSNNRVLRLVRHKPDLTMAIGHGEGPLFVTDTLKEVQAAIAGSEVWIGSTIYVLETEFHNGTDRSKKDAKKHLMPFKLAVEKSTAKKIPPKIK